MDRLLNKNRRSKEREVFRRENCWLEWPTNHLIPQKVRPEPSLKSQNHEDKPSLL